MLTEEGIEDVPCLYEAEDHRGDAEGHEACLWALVADMGSWREIAEAENGENDTGRCALGLLWQQQC